MKAACESL